MPPVWMFWVWHPEEEEGSAASKVGIKLELANHHHNKGVQTPGVSCL